MKRSHQLIFMCIAALAIATFVFGILQFLTLRDNTAPSSSPTNAPAPAPPAQ